MSGAKNIEMILRRHGGAQHGLVTRGQLLSAGIAPHVIQRRIQSGRLERVHRGVYRTGPVAGAYAPEMAAVLACGDECRVSHMSAAVLWKVVAGDTPVEPVEVTVHRGKRRRIPCIRAHRARDLRPDEVTTVHGMPVTTPARTLLDLGGSVGLRELEQALAQAERNNLVKREEVRAMVDRHPRHRGARALRLLLDREGPLAFTRSGAEEVLLGLVRAARLPAPELNARLLHYEVDFLWRAPRLVAEVDGMAFHGSTRMFVEDRRRDAELMAAGYRVLRFTWQDLTTRPEATLVRLAQALVRGPGGAD